MWTEWQDRRRTLRDNLEHLSNSANVHIEHLDDALNIIVRIGVLFKEASFVQQKALLAEVLEKVIVDAEGNVLSLELMPPCTYLSTIVGAVKRQHGLVTTQTKTTLMMGGSCSTKLYSTTAVKFPHYSSPTASIVRVSVSPSATQPS